MSGPMITIFKEIHHKKPPVTTVLSRTDAFYRSSTPRELADVSGSGQSGWSLIHSLQRHLWDHLTCDPFNWGKETELTKCTPLAGMHNKNYYYSLSAYCMLKAMTPLHDLCHLILATVLWGGVLLLILCREQDTGSPLWSHVAGLIQLEGTEPGVWSAATSPCTFWSTTAWEVDTRHHSSPNAMRQRPEKSWWRGWLQLWPEKPSH